MEDPSQVQQYPQEQSSHISNIDPFHFQFHSNDSHLQESCEVNAENTIHPNWNHTVTTSDVSIHTIIDTGTDTSINTNTITDTDTSSTSSTTCTNKEPKVRPISPTQSLSYRKKTALIRQRRCTTSHTRNLLLLSQPPLPLKNTCDVTSSSYPPTSVTKTRSVNRTNTSCSKNLCTTTIDTDCKTDFDDNSDIDTIDMNHHNQNQKFHPRSSLSLLSSFKNRIHSSKMNAEDQHFLSCKQENKQNEQEQAKIEQVDLICLEGNVLEEEEQGEEKKQNESSWRSTSATMTMANINILENTNDTTNGRYSKSFHHSESSYGLSLTPLHIKQKNHFSNPELSSTSIPLLPTVSTKSSPRLFSSSSLSSIQRTKSNLTASLPKHVSFQNLQIRTYNQVLGDHPCCMSGPPLALGWTYTSTKTLDLETYEEQYRTLTCPRRHGRDLKLKDHERRDILLHPMNHEKETHHWLASSSPPVVSAATTTTTTVISISEKDDEDDFIIGHDASCTHSHIVQEEYPSCTTTSFLPTHENTFGQSSSSYPSVHPSGDYTTRKWTSRVTMDSSMAAKREQDNQIHRAELERVEDGSGYSEKEIKRMERKLYRERCNRSSFHGAWQVDFFNTTQQENLMEKNSSTVVEDE